MEMTRHPDKAVETPAVEADKFQKPCYHNMAFLLIEQN
jgi:hypothetical protein